MKYGGCVYILTNRYHTVLYTGVTSDLKQRIWQHKNKEFAGGFTVKYNCDKLVWYDSFLRIEEAIAREKQIKAEAEKRKKL
jgi:putative endonuclease